MSIKVPGTQTNNNAEIFSVIKAIECVKSTGNLRIYLSHRKKNVYMYSIFILSILFKLYLGLTKVNIHTDSEFVIKSVNDWMPKWQTNGWKTSAGTEVKNKDMLLMLQKKIESMESVGWV